jgi:hypothetical protein
VYGLALCIFLVHYITRAHDYPTHPANTNYDKKNPLKMHACLLNDVHSFHATITTAKAAHPKPLFLLLPLSAPIPCHACCAQERTVNSKTHAFVQPVCLTACPPCTGYFASDHVYTNYDVCKTMRTCVPASLSTSSESMMVTIPLHERDCEQNNTHLCRLCARQPIHQQRQGVLGQRQLRLKPAAGCICACSRLYMCM